MTMTTSLSRCLLFVLTTTAFISLLVRQRDVLFFWRNKENRRALTSTASSEFVCEDGLITAWVQVGSDIDGESSLDQSGWSVSLSSDGSTVAIGAPYNNGNGIDSGHARIFRLNNSSNDWVQVGSDINGESSEDLFGWRVSLSSDGSMVAIGAVYNDGNGSESGHVRIFRLNEANEWVQVGSDIDGESPDDRSGIVSLSSDGSTVAFGSPIANGVNGNCSGHVRIFRLNTDSNEWVQVGTDIDGEFSEDFFGFRASLSSDGSLVAISALYNDGNGSDSGHVRIFRLNTDSNDWVQVGSDINGESSDDQSGWSVSLNSDGSMVAIGAVYNDDGNDSESGLGAGHTRIFRLSSSNDWVQVGSDIDGDSSNDFSGWSVSLSSDGSMVAIGALGDNGNGFESGRARIFRLSSSNDWVQVGSDINGESSGDLFGYSVSLSSDGSIVAIGTPYNDDNGRDSGHVQVYELKCTSAPQSASNNSSNSSSIIIGVLVAVAVVVATVGF